MLTSQSSLAVQNLGDRRHWNLDVGRQFSLFHSARLDQVSKHGCVRNRRHWVLGRFVFLDDARQDAEVILLPRFKIASHNQ